MNSHKGTRWSFAREFYLPRETHIDEDHHVRKRTLVALRPLMTEINGKKGNMHVRP